MILYLLMNNHINKNINYLQYNYGNTYGFEWNLWKKKYLYIFSNNLLCDLEDIKKINNQFKNLEWYNINIKDIKKCNQN